MSAPFISKLPPRLGVLSSDKSERPAPEAAVADIKAKFPDPSVDKSWLASPSFIGKVKVTLPDKLDEATKDTACDVPAL